MMWKSPVFWLSVVAGFALMAALIQRSWEGFAVGVAANLIALALLWRRNR